MKEEKINLFIELLKGFQKNIYEPTKHRELAAWAIAVFYITILGVSYKYFDELQVYEKWDYAYLILILLLYFVVTVFIHAQYAMSNYTRAEYFVITGILFDIVKDDLKEDHVDWGFSKVYQYPNFIKERIKKKGDELHKFWNVYPGAIFCWGYSIIEALAIRFIRCLGKKIKSPRIEKFVVCWIDKNKKRSQKDKIDLIESSLYCFVLLPTIFIAVILFVK
jgi:hypothetical protein